MDQLYIKEIGGIKGCESEANSIRASNTDWIEKVSTSPQIEF